MKKPTERSPLALDHGLLYDRAPVTLRCPTTGHYTHKPLCQAELRAPAWPHFGSGTRAGLDHPPQRSDCPLRPPSGRKGGAEAQGCSATLLISPKQTGGPKGTLLDPWGAARVTERRRRRSQVFLQGRCCSGEHFTGKKTAPEVWLLMPPMRSFRCPG